jgi:hypothetical protein
MLLQTLSLKTPLASLMTVQQLPAHGGEKKKGKLLVSAKMMR